MRCKKCGIEIREGASFCPKCGTPTEKVIQQRQVTQRKYNSSREPEPPKPPSNKTDSILIGVLIGLIFIVAVLLLLFAVNIFGKKEKEQTSEHKVVENTTIEETKTATTEKDTEQRTAITTEATTKAATEVTTEVTTQMTTRATTEATVATTKTPQVPEEPIAYPIYDVYVDPDYDFSIKYPSHFILYNDHNHRNRYTLQAPDGSADLKIFSYADPGLSSEALAAEFENAWGGTEEYYRTGPKYYAVRMSRDGRSCYEYGQIDVGRGVTGFTLSYDTEYHDIYDQYVNDIYNSRSWKE